MPKNVLPEAARVLPKAGQKIWLKVFNDALDKGEAEEDASQEAWAAVKRAGFSKGQDGKWSKSMDFETNLELNDDGSFELGVPLIKIDVKKRIVGGFATLDNLDQAGDILDADASTEAFANWFGNIREMHQKKAVGKAVDWRQDTYTDDDGNEFSGVWVEAKISKGAEDTWQKVLDGTLGGFSVGGATQEKERVLAKDGDKEVPAWRITKYRLTELSLVDNPCNRFATISLIKSVDGDTEFSEAIADGEIEKAWNGETGEFADLSSEIGDVVDALERWQGAAIRNKADYDVIRSTELLTGVRSRKNSEECEAKYQSEISKSDDKEENMTDELNKGAEDLQNKEASVTTSVEELTDAEKSIFRKFVDFVKGEEAEASEEPLNKEEDLMNEEELAKAIDEKLEAASADLAKSADERFAQVAESLEKVAGALEKVATAEAVETIKTDITAELEAIKGRLDTVENSGAVQKSGDEVKTGEQKIEKEEGFWGDSIVPTYALRKG
jgi:cation transport regulator ChaB